MNTKWILIPVACFSLAVSGWAEAQGSSRMSSPGKGMRIDTSKQRAVSHARSGTRGAPSRARADFRGPGRGGSGHVSHGRGDSSGIARGGDRNLSHLGNAPLGGLLEEYLYRGYGGNGFDPYEGEKAHADAYRDAAIANAIVNVIGILATANQPQPVAVYAPPAPVAPQGHIERQRVLIQEGRTEEYQVWIPEYTIPATGEVVVGHHETRRRTIEPVYEEREIWVPAQ